MLGRFSVLLLFLLGALLAEHAKAQDVLDGQIKALKAITDAAASICTVVKTEGSSQKVEVSGDVKAELAGVAKRLTDLGISAAGKYTAEKNDLTVLQQDLANAIKSNADCRKGVLELLKDKMIPDQPKNGLLPKTQGQRDEKRLALEALHTAIRATVMSRMERRRYAVSPSLTFSIVINEGVLKIFNGEDEWVRYSARLSDLRPAPEYVRMSNPHGDPDSSFLRIYCLMSECLTEKREERESKTTSVLVYLKNDVDPKPLQEAFARVIRLF